MEAYERGEFVHGWPYWRRMRLVPHGHTVLVEPDPAPEQTDSGLILMPQDQFYVATSGTVVAVGKGSKRLWEERQRAFRLAMAAFDVDSRESFHIHGRIKALANRPEPRPSVCVGDRVVFAAEAGLTVQDDGKDYILLEEDRICIIVDEEAEQREADMMVMHKATRHVGDGFGTSFDKVGA